MKDHLSRSSAHFRFPARPGRACAVFALAWASCQRREPEGIAPPGEALPERGETVVVEKTAAQFVTGRVIARQGDTLRVQGAGDGPSIAARAAEVYRLPSRFSAHPGDLAICGLGSDRWVGCRIESVSTGQLVVTDVDEHGHRVSPADVLAPNELTGLNLQRYFARATERRRFLREAEQAGVPRPPAEWRPRPHERVLGARAGRWYSGKLREVGSERVYVVWQADERVAELGRAELVPEPPYEFSPHRGSFVLARPLSPADPWERVRVEAVLSSERLQVVNVNEERRDLSVGDVIPLG
jgi:hypothetical protein